MGCNGQTPRRPTPELLAELNRRATQSVPNDSGGINTHTPRFGARGAADMRFFSKLMAVLFSPYRWRRLKRWMAVLYPNTRRFVVAVTGPKLDGLEFTARNAACRACPYLEVEYRGCDVPLRDAVAYCGSCGCGRWVMARLWGRAPWHWLPWPKNRLARAYCPQRKQPGPYPDDDFLAWREKVQHEIAAFVDMDLHGGDDPGPNTISMGAEESVVVEVDREGA